MLLLSTAAAAAAGVVVVVVVATAAGGVVLWLPIYLDWSDRGSVIGQIGRERSEVVSVVVAVVDAAVAVSVVNIRRAT